MPHYLMILREGDASIPTMKLTASAFSENPKLMTVVVLAGVSVLLAACAVFVKKRKNL